MRTQNTQGLEEEWRRKKRTNAIAETVQEDVMKNKSFRMGNVSKGART